MLHDLREGGESRELAKHEDLVWAVAYSPDGQSALSGGKDGRVMLHDLASGTPRAAYCCESAVMGMAWAIKGTRLELVVSTGVGKPLRLELINFELAVPAGARPDEIQDMGQSD